MNSLSIGIDINGENVRALLYADDLVLVASSENDLQNLLHMLHSWATTNKMTVYISKSKVVHFRPTSIQRSTFIFKCGNELEILEITDCYVYLGLILHEFLDFNITAKYITKSANRALGLLIAEAKAAGGLPFKVYKKLCDNTVFPVISYAAAVLGINKYSCIEAIQNRACRFYLGVNRYAPNAAVAGNMGWTPMYMYMYIKLNSCVIRHIYRLRNLDENRLNFRIFFMG